MGAGEAGFDMKIPPLYGIVDVFLPIADLPFSFGGEFGFKQFGDSFSYGKETVSYLSIMGRVLWHFNFGVENLDVYAGNDMGTKALIWNYDYNDELLGKDHTSTSWYFDIGFLTGAHYFLNDSFGFFGELGYGFSFAKLGVSFKF